MPLVVWNGEAASDGWLIDNNLIRDPLFYGHSWAEFPSLDHTSNSTLAGAIAALADFCLRVVFT